MDLLKNEVNKHISFNDICGPFYKSFFICYSVYTYNNESIDDMDERIKSIYIYLSNYVCSFNESKFIYKNNIDINKSNIYLYYTVKYNKLKSIDNLTINYNNYFKIKSIYYNNYFKLKTIEDIKTYNKTHLTDRKFVYPAYRIDDIINSICNKYNLSYKFVLSPYDKEKIVVYIFDRDKEEIITFLRNSENINEFSNNEDIAISLLKYFLKYEKKPKI